MKLFYHPMSPFVRKVLIVAEENGLAARIESVPTDTLDEALRAVNPLWRRACRSLPGARIDRPWPSGTTLSCGGRPWPRPIPSPLRVGWTKAATGFFAKSPL
jgi:hypothetical protein